MDKSWEAMPLSERMRCDIAMASCYADEVALLEAHIKKLENKLRLVQHDQECISHYPPYEDECDCWYADIMAIALAGKKEK